MKTKGDLIEDDTPLIEFSNTEKPKRTQQYISISISFFFLCLFGLFILHFIGGLYLTSLNDTSQWQLGSLTLVDGSLLLKIQFHSMTKLTGHLWTNGNHSNPSSSSKSSDSLNLVWTNDRKLSITRETNSNGDIECYTVNWNTTSCISQVLVDCYSLSQAHWYGGYESVYQPWPLETTVRNMSAYILMDYADFETVQERYFVSTNGIGIFIEHDVPLYLGINESKDQAICLSAKYDGLYPYQNPERELPQLKYHICEGQNVRKVHEYMSNRFWKKPTNIPDTKVLSYPIWTTWAVYYQTVTQTDVMHYANHIRNYSLLHSQIEIDDNWTPKYGDMEFQTKKFPNATKMIQELNKLGFRITVWVHPYCNIDSKCFLEGSEAGLFLKQPNSNLPALTRWWDGKIAAMIDVYNEKAVQWFLNKLENLKTKYNVSSFKFDSGDISWFAPSVYSYNTSYGNFNRYPELWARLAYRSDSDIRHQEVRQGFYTQDLPILVRMLDLDSRWDRMNGLQKVIPCALTFGILGYPFVLPDIIGGNGYLFHEASKELYIRWVQANTFLPSMQFSKGPWIFDEETINITRTYINLRAQYANVIIELAQNATKTGAPIVRPLWWIAPNDPISQTLDSEFLLGDDILVAPVLENGARSRDVYLPEGKWKDVLKKETLSGGWHRNYPVALHELPFFIRGH